MSKSEEIAEFRPLSDAPFHFDCHKGISCFTECCARLRLLLTPYDILRMKQRLRLPSDEFLDLYTETITDAHRRFPMVRLKMSGDRKGACPFVTADGCTIYEDRPEACRLYPVGRASAAAGSGTGSYDKFFVVAESHCLGFKEQREWTLDEWLRHEGVKEYAKMNESWLGIVTSAKTLGDRAHLPRKHQMFFMASYNLDKFRTFLFKSGFFDRFEVEPALKERMKTDDVALMHFGCDWLRFSLFGEKTLTVRA